MSQRMENRPAMAAAARVALLQELVQTDAFERFLALRFPGTKVSAGSGHHRQGGSLSCTCKAMLVAMPGRWLSSCSNSSP